MGDDLSVLIIPSPSGGTRWIIPVNRVSARGWRCLFISISGICDTAVDGARSLPRSLLLALATVQLTGEPWMHTQEININKRANWSRLMSFAYVACWESKTKNKLISIMRGAPLQPVWVKPDRTFKIPSRWESSFCGHRVDVHWPAFFSSFFMVVMDLQVQSLGCFFKGKCLSKTANQVISNQY